MRPILTIVAVLVAALTGYYVFRDAPSQPAGIQPRTGTQYPAPKTARPQTGGTQRTVQGEMGEITVNVPDGFEARFESGVLTWRDMVSDEYLVTMEEAWDLDLSAVDLDADVLCVVDGIEITRDALRSRVLLEYGQAILNARYFSLVGQMAADETGLPYSLTDAEWQGYWQDWLTARGMDEETATAYLSVKMRVAPEEVQPLRRQMAEAVLACFPPVESVDELPLGLGEVFASTDEMRQAATLGRLMRDQIVAAGKDSDEGGFGTPIAGLLEPMSVLFNQMGSEVRFRRAWTTLEHELPEGVLAAFYTGELDEDAILPPWEHAGDRELILIDDLWEKVAPTLPEGILRAELREVVRAEVLGAKLAEAGVLPEPGQAWRAFAEDYLAHQTTFIKLDLKIQTNGYPGRAFYIEDQALTAGILATQPEGWDDEERLRDFFEANRFFVLGWEPTLEIALFQPRDPRWSAERPADWELARSQAQEFHDRVAAGEDFTTLRTAQNQGILQAYQEVNQELAEVFAAEFGTGEFQQTMAMTRQVLRHSVYRDHVDGVSPLRNAVVRLDAGEVSPPWKTPIGYIVVRMRDAAMSRLEREFEDVIDLTRYEYEQHLIRRHVTAALAGSEVVVPGA